MKKCKSAGVAALVLMALSDPAIISVSANITDYQETYIDTGDTVSADCEVIYKTTYDFSESIPKYPKLEVSVSGYDGVYDGEPHGITVRCDIGGATILYSTDGKTYTTKKPEYKDAGTYVTYYKVEKDGYITTTGSETVKIKEAIIEFDANDCNCFYDGKKHSIDLSVKTKGCQILYSEDGINFTSKKPEYKEPGTYIVYYKIVKDNYETVTGSSKLIIKEQDGGIKLPGTGDTINIGETIRVPVDAGGKLFDVTVSESDVISVSVKNGVMSITGLKKGTATITITCNGKTATYKIKVVGNGNNNSNSSVSNVQTGDENNILLYGTMFIASLFVLLGSRGRKEKRKL